MNSRRRRFRRGCRPLILVAAVAVQCSAKPQALAQPESNLPPSPRATVNRTVTDPDETAGQPPSDFSDPAMGPFSTTKLGMSLLKNMARDQRAIWTSSKNLRFADLTWLVPLGGVAAASLKADTGISKAVTGSSSRVSKSKSVSNFGLATLAGAVGGSYLLGRMNHDDHLRETGLLSGESAVDAVAVTTALQYAFGRQRPADGHGGGGFWRDGTSFPSNHATAAWAVASVMAREYPGPLPKMLAYGLASAVSASRITGKEHFPTDVLAGSAIGWFVGRYVYSAHHDAELGGGAKALPSRGIKEPAEASPENAASAFVPLDSWVYPAFDRLVAMGYATTAFEGLKPWTRIECGRLTQEVGDALLEASGEDSQPDEQVAKLQEQLAREFAREIAVLGGEQNESLALESVYARAMSLSGPILTEGYHLGGQTISYDFGRPFRRGANTLMGASADATLGPLAVFARVEYQHAPSAPALPGTVLQFISTNDHLPLEVPSAFRPVNRADLLEGYVSFNHAGWQISAGKQALSWNVGEGGGMLLSDNAEPLYMARLTRVIPTELPGFLRLAGQFRTEWFLAETNGGPFVPHPLLHGEKFSFHVTPYLELGFARTSLLGRGGHAIGGDAFNTSNFLRDFFAVARQYGATRVIPGDNRSSMDLNLDLPGLKHSVSLYGDFYSDNVPLYLVDPPISAYRAGMYLARLPHLRRMDLRLESTSTMSPVYEHPYGGLTTYWADRYREGYTNYGELLGNTVGRRGRIFQGWTTFHISPLQQIQLAVAHHQVDPKFVPGGGLWQDYAVSHEIRLRSGVYAKSMVQVERIQHFPFLFNAPVNNVSASVELGWAPEWAKR